MDCHYISCLVCFFFFKQKTAYEMRISDWSSDVCSSDLCLPGHRLDPAERRAGMHAGAGGAGRLPRPHRRLGTRGAVLPEVIAEASAGAAWGRSEEHTSELQSLMRISYAVFCLKKKKATTSNHPYTNHIHT